MLPPSLGPIQAEARADIMAEWLSRKLGVEVEVEVAPSYDLLRQAIENQEVDVAWAPPSICANVERSNVQIFKAVRNGRSSYCSAIVERSADAAGLSGIKGKNAAWVDPMSLAGYQLPVAHLRRNGIDPEHDLGGQDFLGAYGAALRTVLANRADIAAVYCSDPQEDALERRLHELLGSAGALLRLVSFTPAVPSDGLVVLGHAKQRGLDVDHFQRLFDGTDGYTFFLSLLEADRLTPSKPGEYGILRD
jgi:ABC-type phosphate/phosphonate transport system substrate-binding protein